MRICTADVSVRSKQFGVARHAHVEGILHRAGRMVGRDVQRLEVVPVVLDLRAFGDTEPEAREDLDGLALDDRERVEAAQPRRAPGQAHVEPVGLEQGVLGQALQGLALGGERRLQCLACLVGRLPHPLAVIGLERAQPLLDRAERRASPHDLDLRRIELLDRAPRPSNSATPRSRSWVERSKHLLGVHQGPESTGRSSRGPAEPRSSGARDVRTGRQLEMEAEPPALDASPSTGRPVLRRPLARRTARSCCRLPPPGAAA